MKPNPTDAERKARKEWIERILGGVPPSADWPRAFVGIVEDMAAHTEDALLAPPGAVTAEDRVYNAGRIAFARDLLARLERYHRAAHAATPPVPPVG